MIADYLIQNLIGNSLDKSLINEVYTQYACALQNYSRVISRALEYQ